MARDEAREIAGLIERLSRLMRSQDHGAGLNPAQWEALRYLERANRFSNSPIAVARYLGATKGTVSQTLNALERKGLVAKARHRGGGRLVALALTPEGRALLMQAPARRVEEAAGELTPKSRKRLLKNLSSLIVEDARRSHAPSFGECRTCRFHRERGRDGHAEGPHLCLLFDEPIGAAQSHLICIEHSPA